MRKKGPSAYVCTLACSIWLSGGALLISHRSHHLHGRGEKYFRGWQRILHSHTRPLRPLETQWTKLKYETRRKSFCRPTIRASDNRLYVRITRGQWPLRLETGMVATDKPRSTKGSQIKLPQRSEYPLHDLRWKMFQTLLLISSVANLSPLDLLRGFARQVASKKTNQLNSRPTDSLTLALASLAASASAAMALWSCTGRRTSFLKGRRRKRQQRIKESERREGGGEGKGRISRTEGRTPSQTAPKFSPKSGCAFEKVALPTFDLDTPSAPRQSDKIT